MFEGKKIYLVTWSGYGFPEWDILVDEENARQIIKETMMSGHVRPDIYEITVEEIRKFILGE